jgi:hypothetical protein
MFIGAFRDLVLTNGGVGASARKKSRAGSSKRRQGSNKDLY